VVDQSCALCGINNTTPNLANLQSKAPMSAQNPKSQPFQLTEIARRYGFRLKNNIENNNNSATARAKRKIMA
jgi:hypothetical protein